MDWKGVDVVFKKENLALLFDEHNAILYSVLTGGIKKMTINDGKKLEKILKSGKKKKSQSKTGVTSENII